MPSVFPGAIDSFTDPLTSSPLNSPSHAGQHQDLNDAVEKVEQYMGLVKVIPTGATNGTLGATGTVTIGNAVTSVTVSGAFSSLYDAYKIVVTGGGSSVNGVFLSLQLSSVTTGYYGGLIGTVYTSGAFAGLGLNNASSWSYAGWGSAAGIALSCDLTNPFLASRTFISSGLVYNLTGSAYSYFVGEATDASSRTGFVIAPASGTLTGGTIRVYGYRN